MGQNVTDKQLTAYRFELFVGNQLCMRIEYLILIKLLSLILNPRLYSCFCKLSSVTVTSIKINSILL
jgi:hypothetical protein